MLVMKKEEWSYVLCLLYVHLVCNTHTSVYIHGAELLVAMPPQVVTWVTLDSSRADAFGASGQSDYGCA